MTYAFLPESPVVTGIEYRNTSLAPGDIGTWVVCIVCGRAFGGVGGGGVGYAYTSIPTIHTIHITTPRNHPGVDGHTNATTRITASTLTMRLPGRLERDTQVGGHGRHWPRRSLVIISFMSCWHHTPHAHIMPAVSRPRSYPARLGTHSPQPSGH